MKGPAKGTQAVSDGPSAESLPKGLRKWRGKRPQAEPVWQRLLGYLCWDRNMAAQRQSRKCCATEARERKESSENEGKLDQDKSVYYITAQPPFLVGLSTVAGAISKCLSRCSAALTVANPPSGNSF